MAASGPVPWPARRARGRPGPRRPDGRQSTAGRPGRRGAWRLARAPGPRQLRARPRGRGVGSALLVRCPHTRALVTSRAVLRATGGYDSPVPPLPLPDPGPLPPLQDLGRNAAVALFVQRAQAARRRLRAHRGQRTGGAGICRRLDGLPLAIELAAAWARVLPPEALLARLGSRLALLSGGPPDQPARRRTMRDVLSWSHDLLSADERASFRRLAVFPSGFTLDGGGGDGRDGRPRRRGRRRRRRPGQGSPPDREEPARTRGAPRRRAARSGCSRRSASPGPSS